MAHCDLPTGLPRSGVDVSSTVLLTLRPAAPCPHAPGIPMSHAGSAQGRGTGQWSTPNQRQACLKNIQFHCVQNTAPHSAPQQHGITTITASGPESLHRAPASSPARTRLGLCILPMHLTDASHQCIPPMTMGLHLAPLCQERSDC